MKNIKLLAALFTLCLFISGCCCLGKPPCFSCHKKPFSVCHANKCGSECPFSKCFMKSSCCAIKNKGKLGLSTEQEAKLKALCTKTKKETIQLDADANKVCVDIKAKLSEEVFNKTAINALIDKKFELKKQIVKTVVNSHAELISILTPEQNQKFKALMKECKNDCCSKGKCCDGKDCS